MHGQHGQVQVSLPTVFSKQLPAHSFFFPLSKSLSLQNILKTYQPHIIVILALITTTNLRLEVLHASLLIRIGRNIEWLEESAVVRIILGFFIEQLNELLRKVNPHSIFFPAPTS